MRSVFCTIISSRVQSINACLHPSVLLEIGIGIGFGIGIGIGVDIDIGHDQRLAR